MVGVQEMYGYYLETIFGLSTDNIQANVYMYKIHTDLFSKTRLLNTPLYTLSCHTPTSQKLVFV